jgi:hypothetical protein
MTTPALAQAAKVPFYAIFSQRQHLIRLPS